MRMFAGRLSVSNGSIGKKTPARDTLILSVGSAGGEACHQVTAPVGASEFVQLASRPESSNAEASTPSDSLAAVLEGLPVLGSPARNATGMAPATTSAWPVRV